MNIGNARVIIRWDQEISRIKQIALLKKIYSRLKSISNVDLLNKSREDT